MEEVEWENEEMGEGLEILPSPWSISCMARLVLYFYDLLCPQKKKQLKIFLKQKKR